MNHIIKFAYSFLTDGLVYVFQIIPIYILARLLFLECKIKNNLADKIRPEHEFVLFGFVIYLILLFTQTFVVNSGQNEIRLIPFDIIINQIRSMNENDDTYGEFMFNILGNIGVFVPIGIFLKYLFGKDLMHTALMGFYISLVIETVQLPLDRTSDIDDLILNTIGAVIGYLLFVIFRKLISVLKKAYLKHT